MAAGGHTFFALAQSIPGPNMILMMTFVGWRVGGIAGAIASAFATFGTPCVMYFFTYRAWHRFRYSPWQRAVRIRLVPVTVGLVIGGGTVMARTADTGWMAAGVTVAAAMLMLRTRLNPMLMLVAGGLAGGLGLLG